MPRTYAFWRLEFQYWRGAGLWCVIPMAGGRVAWCICAGPFEIRWLRKGES